MIVIAASPGFYQETMMMISDALISYLLKTNDERPWGVDEASLSRITWK